jgi:hypothetical protein
MPSTILPREISLLLTTCLRWTPDGELCAEERWLLLHRLMQNDPYLAEGMSH